MGDQKNSDDWLPEGWSMEVKVRRDGKKDKFYFSPCGEVKLQSKIEVLRYLKNNEDTSDKEDDTRQKKVESARSQKKVVFEKAIADGLPPGWTKEVKITKKGNKIRRDPFYTDPVSGYVFRSMKDALRYIDTGNLGRLAFKPKDKEEMNVEVEEENTSTPAATKKQKLEDKEAGSLTVDELSLKCCGSEKDELTQNSTSTGESIPVHDHTHDQCGLHAGISNSEWPIAEGVSPSNGESHSNKSERSEVHAGLASELTSTVNVGANSSNGNGDSIKSGSYVMPAELGPKFSISDLPIDNTVDQLNANIDSSSGEFSVTPAAEVLPAEQPMVNGVGSDETKSPAPGRSKKKKDLNLPRRASKRLAGVPVDPALEVKTKNRTRRVAVLESHGMAGAVVEDTSSHQTDAVPEVMVKFDDRDHEMPADKHSKGNVGAPSQLPEKGEMVRNGDENQEFAATPLVVVQASTEEHAERVGGDINIDQKPELPLDLPLGELWQDPCIAFAIQTLTGSSFDNSDSIKVSQSELKCVATSDSAVPEHPVGVPDILSKADDEAASPQSMLPIDAWSDPCIEFAIKTLTDAIPLDYGVVIQDFLPQQSTSSQSQSNCSLNLPSSSEFCQTKFLCQSFGASSQPMFNQAGLVEPAIPLPGNPSLRYPGGASHQRSEERSKRCVR